jgi:hypothetical protein
MSLRQGFVFSLAAVVGVVLIPAVAPAATTLLYKQVFPPPVSGSTIPPWSIDMVGGFQGTYTGFDATGEHDASTGMPIGRTGPADTLGTALFTGIGGPVTANLRGFFTVDGQPNDTFASFDPTVDCKDCYFNIWARRTGGGLNDTAYFVAGQIDSNTNAMQWYVSTTPMADPVSNGGSAFDLRSLKFDPSAGNWNKLTMAPSTTIAPVLSGGPTSFPAGSIDGVGVLMSVTSAATGDQFSSWDFSDYRISCGGPVSPNVVPEPASVVLMACGGLALLWFRKVL